MAKKLTGYYIAAGEDLSSYSEQEKVNLLGGKGAGLQFMLANGINVPPFVTIPTAVYADYATSPSKTMTAIESQLDDICDYFIDQFGYMPLLSVRSGARVSMPGMMDTVLNVGIDDVTLPFWTEKLGAACVQNCKLRLREMYGSTVLALPKSKQKTAKLPDAKGQLLACIEAVFQSWNTERAQIYRKLHDIPDDWGTAVTIQAMVFGNYNEQSCSGVLFTRNPDTGDNVITGEFLPNAQGEDVVAGTATPLKLEDMIAWNKDVFKELVQTVGNLELLKRDVQDVEFTVQDGKLYVLQTRNAKRSATAAIRIAVDMYKGKLLTAKEAIGRVSVKQYDLSQLPVIDPHFKEAPLFTGIPACSGVVTGVVVASAQAAIDCKVPCIMVTKETTPDDIGGMIAANGVLTMTGGATSHAAVVARGMNKPCVVGLSQDLSNFTAGETISIDGATGRVWKGAVPVIASSDSQHLQDFKTLMWEQVDALPINGDDASYITTAETILMPMTDRIKSVLGQVAKAKGRVYIDCCAHFTHIEASFYGCFIKSDHLSNLELQTLFVSYLTGELKAKPALKGKVVLVGVEEAGFACVTVVDSLVKLITAEGDIIIDNLSEEIYADGHKAVAKLLQLKGKEINQLSVGEIKQGAKSFISEHRLIATLLNAK